MNSLESLIRQPLILALGWALLHFLWQGVLIAMLLGGVNLLLHRAGAGARYAASCAAMLAMLSAGVGTFLWLVLHAGTSSATSIGDVLISTTSLINLPASEHARSVKATRCSEFARESTISTAFPLRGW